VGGAGTPPGIKRPGARRAAAGGATARPVAVGVAATGTSLASGASIDLTSNRDLAVKYLSAEGVKDLSFTVTSDKLDEVKLTYDGQPVEGVREGNSLVYRPTALGEGKHEFVASAKGRFGRAATETHAFEVDTVAPIVAVDKQENVAEGPFVLTGSIEGAQAVKIDDKDVSLSDGKFRVEYPQRPSSVKVWAQDAAGNVTEQSVSINGSGQTAVPGVRAAHITARGWGNSGLRAGIMSLVKEKKIDTVQLDIKDEDGVIGYEWDNATAKAAGATSNFYDARAAIDEIHAAGARVVGRIVAFRDPKLGKWAVNSGKMDMVIQNTSGGPYATAKYGTGTFTNFANPDVIEYNTRLGEEATKLGFDEIMYDYIRKPENEGQVYKGIGDRTPRQAVADFVEIAAKRIHAVNGKIGAAVYGISAYTPTLVAQDIPMMAKHLDFLAPMTYPSHWGPGVYGIANPNGQPFDILKASLMDFNRLVLTTNPNCAIIPWIQDFSIPVGYSPYIKYGPDMVRKQIEGARAVGINGFYLWNAGATYQGAALDVREAKDNGPGKLIYSINKPGNTSVGTDDAAKAKTYIDAYLVWKDGGKQGLFQSPLEAPAAGTPGEAPASGQTPAAPSTPAPSTAPSAAPSASASAKP
ncbi:MAG: putative glycoside hydrolase, partial [Sporichthyaceae bacterium]